jgi:MFS transporter, ACS family, hexuronate transporter
MASTMINYIDRQTVSVMAPYLKLEYHWRNEDLAWIFIVFRLTYGLGQSFFGRFLDYVGTKRGLTITVLWYSMAASLTSLATGFRSFLFFRGLLGAGESANWPGATKAVSEWFPRRERAIAVAVFDSGSSIGAAFSPWLVMYAYKFFGGWRPVFVVTGICGILWVIAWRLLYDVPENHPNIRKEELEMILAERSAPSSIPGGASLRQLLSRRRTWGIIVGRSMMDPIWFFVMDWLAVVLVAKGIRIVDNLFDFWIPFLAADLGSLSGGAISGWLIRRGWSISSARMLPLGAYALGLLSLCPIAYLSRALPIALCFGTATFSYAAWTTIILVLPADLFPTSDVATVSGLSGTGGGLMTVLSTYLVGYISDHFSFSPVLMVAGIVPLVATALVLMLIRKSAFELSV